MRRGGGAVSITGRGGHPGGPDPTAQNWESGIDLTMLRCTFFRNFAAFYTAGIFVADPWPFVADMVANAFIHNDALVAVAEHYWWDPPVRTFLELDGKPMA